MHWFSSFFVFFLVFLGIGCQEIFPETPEVQTPVTCPTNCECSHRDYVCGRGIRYTFPTPRVGDAYDLVFNLYIFGPFFSPTSSVTILIDGVDVRNYEYRPPQVCDKRDVLFDSIPFRVQREQTIVDFQVQDGALVMGILDLFTNGLSDCDGIQNSQAMLRPHTPDCSLLNNCSNHGNCVFPNRCNCLSPYQGIDCGECSANRYNYPSCSFCLNTTTCSGNGACSDQGGCDCNLGWTGNNCSTPFCDACIFGSCVAPFECECQPAWFGPTCNESCQNDTCKNGGFCDENGLCDCVEELFIGPTCEVPVCIPACVNGECVEGLSEQNETQNFCECSSDYEGSICDVPRCNPPCANGGSCVQPDTCDCTGTGYGGTLCEIKVEAQESKNDVSTITIATSAIGGGIFLVLLLGFILLLCQRRKLRKDNSEGSNAIPLNEMENNTIYDSLPSEHEGRGSIYLEGIAWAIDSAEIKINKEIGRGAFGIVYSATWRELDVAVKKIVGHNITMEQKKDFANECKLMQSLRPHNNVVQLLGIVVNPLCIVTTLYKKGSLYRLLHSSDEITLKQKISIMKGIASGMNHLHKENVIHRDLAARNVLLDENYNPAVSDFGMSRITEGNDKGGTTQTETGPLKWMAPESLKDRIYSTKSDVWAFGVTCWEILTRSDPFAGRSALEAAFLVRDGHHLDIPKYASKEIEEMFEKCWSFKPEDRPEMEELVEILKDELAKLQSII